MARSARLDVTVDGSGAKAGASDVDRELNKLKGTAQSVDRQMEDLSASANKAGGAMKGAGAAASEMAAAAQKSAAATKALDQAVRQTGTTSGLAKHHVQNLAFQINDLGVQLASGANPMMAFVQQGSQIGGIMSQAGIGVKGLTIALYEMAKAGVIAVATNPLLLALTAAILTAYGAFKLFQSSVAQTGELDAYVKSLGLTKAEMKELGDVGITVGDVFTGLWRTIDEGLGLSEVFASIKGWAVDAFEWALNAAKNAVAGIYGGFVGAFDGIKAIWQNFPAIMGDFAISAANAHIAAVEYLANKIIAVVNKLSAGVNAAASAMGMDVHLGQLDPVSLDRIANPYAGAGAKAADAFSSGFERGMNDALGKMDALGKKLRDNIVGAAKDRIGDKAKALIDDRSEKAAKGAKSSTDELGKALEQLRAQYDPLKDAAKAYADELEKIDALQKAGRIDSYEAEKFRQGAEGRFSDKKLQIDKPTLSSVVQEGFTKPMIDAADLTAKALIEGGKTTAEVLAEQGLDAAQQIAQVLGGSVGGTFSKIIAAIQGMQSGDFSGVGGKAGQFLQMMNQFSSFSGTKSDLIGGSVVDKASADAMKQALDGTFQGGMAKVFDPLKKVIKDLGGKLGELFGQGGAMSQMLGQASAGAAVGSAVGGVMKGLGIKTSQTGAQIGGAIGAMIPIPGMSIVGSIAGGLIGGALMKTKKGSSTIGYNQYGDFGITSTVGNSNSRKEASINSANSVISSLQNIADQLGGNIGGAFGVSIGMRNKNYVVDPSGQGRTKGAGVLKFKDEAAALKAAIQDAIRDGAIEGLRAGAKALLNGAGDIEAQLQKAVKFENVFRELKARADPVGAAIDDLNTQFEGLKRIFREAGASTEEWASLEELYQAKRLDLIEQGNNAALKSMQDYLNDLKGGSSSPLSAQIKYANTLASLTQLDAKRASGGAVDFADYQAKADAFLAASREFNGSNATFFRDFERITSTVQGLINAEMNKVTSTAPTVDFTPVVAAVQEQTTVTGNLLQLIAQRLAAMNGAASTTGATAANDTAAATAAARYYLNF